MTGPNGSMQSSDRPERVERGNFVMELPQDSYGVIPDGCASGGRLFEHGS